MSYVVRTLRQTRVPDDQPIVASIFCSGKESEAALVTSVIVQLLQSHKSRNDGVRMVLPIPRFKSYKEQQNLDILWESLRLIIPDRAAVTVVIDGVDKLYPSVRSSFLDHFMALKEGSAGRYMRVIVSSTSDTDAHHFLSNFVQIDREKERRGENRSMRLTMTRLTICSRVFKYARFPGVECKRKSRRGCEGRRDLAIITYCIQRVE